MEIVRVPAELGRSRPVMLAIGNFDGVHRGHQWLLGQLVAQAERAACESCVLVFRPHPRVLLQPRAPRQFLTTPQQQRDIFRRLGLDVLIEQPFDLAFASTEPHAFVAQLVSSLDLRQVWVGQDFQFGRNRAGNVDVLRELGRRFGFEVHAVERRVLEPTGEPISSSRIRGALTEGDVEEAGRLLGRPYELTGRVVRGDARGKTIGVPTANLQPDDDLLVPGSGVYYTEVPIAGILHAAATNVGVRPTVDGTRLSVETHVLDFDGDLYDQVLAVRFLARLRPEQKFGSLDELVAQIGRDLDEVRRRAREMERESWAVREPVAG